MKLLDQHDPIIRCSYSANLPLEELQPHPANPNQHSVEQIKLFIEILRYQGCRRPVTVSNRSQYVIKGHGQLAAYKLAGWEKIPVDFQDYDSTEAELADMVADNQLQRMSEMSKSGLQEIIATLDNGEFDLSLTGLPESELEPLMTSVFIPDDEDDERAPAEKTQKECPQCGFRF